LYALDPETFQFRWAFPDSAGEDVDSGALYGGQAVDNSSVYIPTYDEGLYAVELESGQLKWPAAQRANQQLVGGATVGNGLVYFGDSSGHVVALDAETGDLEWSFTTDKEVWSTPLLAEEALYVTSLDGSLYALDAASGDELWSYQTDGGIAATPVLSGAGGVIITGGFDSKLRAIDLTTHEERWSGTADNWFWATPLVANGIVYAPSLDHKVYAFNIESGESAWDDPFELSSEIRTSPVLVGGVLVAVDRDGNVSGIDPQDGSRVNGPLDLGSGVNADPLLLSNGEVLIVTDGGDMVRIDAETMTIVQRTPLRS
jgi:outer membrane protein assembly factor BamB